MSTPMNWASDDRRSVRIFVSSTFVDMQADRNVLVTKVFPALRAKYRARGVEVFEVDLRWGITREQQERGETLPTLMAEVDRCHPYFIGLLGDRYGWVPPPEALTEKLKMEYPALRDAAGSSVTAMEIAHGVLSRPNDSGQALFFQRDSRWDWEASLSAEDRSGLTPETQESGAKLAALKALIRRRTNIEEYAHPEELGQKVQQALDALLEARFPQTTAPDPFDQAAALHRAYASDRTAMHVGADRHLAQLTHWAQQREAPPVLVVGASGAGKSTLIANWLREWRANHGGDLVFEHYLGASPDSADPKLIMRRLWEYLNRADTEIEPLPDLDSDVMELSTRLTLRLAKARVHAERRGARVVIALDGLDKLSSERDLRWLPSSPGVHIVASSVGGDIQTAALARGFWPLKVGPLSDQQSRDFITATLSHWHRGLASDLISKILSPSATELAGSPLYLKTLLDELRVSADHAHLEERLDVYRSARDLADLFDRVLQRLEKDCGEQLVANALQLIWASRAGLEENEIIALTDVSPLAWATLRNSLPDGLRDLAGRINFGHDYLRQAVHTRYLPSAIHRHAAHMRIAGRFSQHESEARKAEELPFQLRMARAWPALEAALGDLDLFGALADRGELELLAHWLPLKERGCEPEEVLGRAIDERLQAPGNWDEDDLTLAMRIQSFLRFSGANGARRERLNESILAACRVQLGDTHDITILSMSNLAEARFCRGNPGGQQEMLEAAFQICLDNPTTSSTTTQIVARNLTDALRYTGDYERARALGVAVLETTRRTNGHEHPITLSAAEGLAQTLRLEGDISRTRKLQEELLQTRLRLFGEENVDTLRTMGDLGDTLRLQGEVDSSITILRRAEELSSRHFGEAHPISLAIIGSLSASLIAKGALSDAQNLLERANTTAISIWGQSHPETLTLANNLADVCRMRGDFSHAAKLFERVLAERTERLGPIHPHTLATKSSLAATLFMLGDLETAREGLESALSAMVAAYGDHHPDILKHKANLATVLQALGKTDEAQRLLEASLEAARAELGERHTDTLTLMNRLGDTLRLRGDISGARMLLTRAQRVSAEALGTAHPTTLMSLVSLAMTLMDSGDLLRAENLNREALTIAQQLYGGEHPDTLTIMSNLASVLMARGDVESAARLYTHALEATRRAFGDTHLATLTVTSNLGMALCKLGDIEAGLPLLDQAAAGLAKLVGHDHDSYRQCAQAADFIRRSNIS